jgi:AcrR family transcriptional regulator
MEPTRPAGATQKAELTRRRILDTALGLFASRGYDETTMRDIAAEAGCSLGLAYRYFASKEEMVLELYRNCAREHTAYVQTTLPPGTLADRFKKTMRFVVEQMTPYRETLGTLFGATLNPRSKVGVFSVESADIRRNSRAVYVTVAAGAKDAPRQSQISDIATVLYSMHFGVLIFWLQDLSEGTQKTFELIDFLSDMLALVRPLLALPPTSRALVRAASIFGPMMGDDEGSSRNSN